MDPPGGIPGDPLEGGDTEPNAIEVDDGDVEAVSESETTGAIRVCGECGRKVFDMAGSPNPRLEDLVAMDTYWDPKGKQPGAPSCIVSGTSEAVTWWFCPFTRWFALRGVFRVQVVRLPK